MSRHVAKLVYDRKVGSMLRKAVLAYFAERANDDGSMIWASKKTIAAEIECSKQAVINTVNQFVAEGVLQERGHRKTQGGFTKIYDMDLAIIAALPTAKQSTPFTGQHMDQSTPLAEPVNPVDPDQSTPLTQTVHEPSIEPDAKASRRAKSKPPPFILPDWVPAEQWSAFAAMRQTIRKPMTDYAKTLVVTELQNLADDGHPPGAVLDQSTRNNWQDVYKIKDKQNGHGNNRKGASRNFGQPDRRDGFERACDRAIERADGEIERRQAGGVGTGGPPAIAGPAVL